MWHSEIRVGDLVLALMSIWNGGFCNSVAVLEFSGETVNISNTEVKILMNPWVHVSVIVRIGKVR